MGWFRSQAQAAFAALVLFAVSPAAAEVAPAPALEIEAAAPAEFVGEGDAQEARVRQLTTQLQFALFRETACPGQAQALRIISEVIEGWDLETAGSALQLLASEHQLCPAVGAVLATVRGAVQTAQSAQTGNGAGEEAAPGDTVGGTPGGVGGPGYRGRETTRQ